MAPLIPQGFVNPDLNLFFAFVIGLGFGYVLEQAGFSSSRKLAGVFYGYDFVVLRVFFTAAITAMSGLLIFSYMGWIDDRLLYINPTYLWSAIVGGVIMGVGFILGGFCPGTSMVAAVIGKIDAMIFVTGMFIGIFIFGEFYEVFEPLYMGSYLGGLFVFDSLGMSREWFAMILIVVALMAFVVTQYIEDQVNKVSFEEKNTRPAYWTPAFIIIGLGVLMIMLPSKPRSNWNETSAQKLLNDVVNGNHLVDAEEIAYSLVNGKDRPLQLVDVRSPGEFAQFSLPGAVNIPIGQILENQSEAILSDKNNKVVLYSNATTLSSEAWLVATRAGIEELYVLDGGLNGFIQTVFLEKPADPAHNMNLAYQNRFREKARQYFLSGQSAASPKTLSVPVIQTIGEKPKAKGGC